MASCQELSERTCQSTGSAGKLLIGQQTQELRQQFDEYRQELSQVDQRLRDVHDKSVLSHLLVLYTWTFNWFHHSLPLFTYC